MALKQIKNKIVSTQKIGKVTKAMESVSAVKMRKSQERAFQSRPYVHTALRILAQLSQGEVVSSHPLAVKRTGNKKLLVIVTSDKGLAGSVNSAVLKQVEKILSASREVAVVAIGRKALEFAERENLSVVASYTNISDDVTVPDIYDMTDNILSHYTNNLEVTEVSVIYQNFVSTFEQKPTNRRVLPVDPEEIHYIMQGIKPKTGKFSDEGDIKTEVIDYIIEPNAEAVLGTLIPQLIQIMLFHALLESKASEHSARMVAMKNATDKSKEVTKSLNLLFNKARQAAITAEVSEITGGIEAMK